MAFSLHAILPSKKYQNNRQAILKKNLAMRNSESVCKYIFKKAWKKYIFQKRIKK